MYFSICPILDNYECEEMINDKWNLLEYLTKDFEIPSEKEFSKTIKGTLRVRRLSVPRNVYAAVAS